MPGGALIAGSDSHICDGTACGKDIFVSMINVDGGVAAGKTWFTRDDGACASVATGREGSSGVGTVSEGRERCRVLTMGSATHGTVRFAWEAVDARGNADNRYTAPPRALVAGNDPDDHGPLYVCRFQDETGDWLVGQTWFPRHDVACCSAEYGGGVVTAQHCEILTTPRC